MLDRGLLHAVPALYAAALPLLLLRLLALPLLRLGLRRQLRLPLPLLLLSRRGALALLPLRPLLVLLLLGTALLDHLFHPIILLRVLRHHLLHLLLLLLFDGAHQLEVCLVTVVALVLARRRRHPYRHLTVLHRQPALRRQRRHRAAAVNVVRRRLLPARVAGGGLRVGCLHSDARRRCRARHAPLRGVLHRWRLHLHRRRRAHRLLWGHLRLPSVGQHDRRAGHRLATGPGGLRGGRRQRVGVAHRGLLRDGGHRRSWRNCVDVRLRRARVRLGRLGWQRQRRRIGRITRNVESAGMVPPGDGGRVGGVADCDILPRLRRRVCAGHRHRAARQLGAAVVEEDVDLGDDVLPSAVRPVELELLHHLVGDRLGRVVDGVHLEGDRLGLAVEHHRARQLNLVGRARLMRQVNRVAAAARVRRRL
mmetsp:Transcript_28592/g.91596  ORF Transcript_28592/g.91596 Transcript_28592/m.91596 type:complete len:422 (-) Transcript_28592:91-1356(-)